MYFDTYMVNRCEVCGKFFKHNAHNEYLAPGYTLECPHCHSQLEARRNDPDIVLTSGVIVDKEIPGDDPDWGYMVGVEWPHLQVPMS